MSFKSLDLQMSIPRTPEASGIQSHTAHRPVADQARLAAASSEQTLELRHKNTRLEETSGQTIRGNGNRQQGGGSGDRQQEGRKEASEDGPRDTDSSHPYKGRHIDISL